MPLKIIYLLAGLVRRVFGLTVLMFRTDLAKDAELLVLRHEQGQGSQMAGCALSAISCRSRHAASADAQPSCGWEPPPDHRGGSGLAGVPQSDPALPGAVHADAQIEVIGRLPGECPVGQLPQAST